MILKKVEKVRHCKQYKSTFKQIASGVPQRSFVGPILFNFFFNDFFYFILVSSAHTFADDNTL